MVKWEKIGEISSNVFAGGTPSTKRDDFYDGDIPWIRSGEIDFNVIRCAERNISELGYKNSSAKKIKPNSVVMAMTGATVAKSAVVAIETSANQSVCAIEPKQDVANYKFIYYCLANDYFKIKASAQGALTSLNLAMIKNIELPMPPLSEQERIVAILDTFTKSIENLKEQIAQRRKQYEYYRDQLLDLEGKPGVEMKSLGEIGTFIRGTGIQKADFVENGFPCIHYGQIHTKYGLSASETISFINESLYKKSKKAKKGDVVIATTSEDAECVAKPVAWLGEEEVAVSGDAFIFHHQQNGKFIAHLFATHNFMLFKVKYATGAKVVRISGDSMAKFTFGLPLLAEQQRIVSILDQFESSIKNLEEQLKQREKQYEYYRNKLLTFE